MLTNCPECNKEVSSSASKCPHCGFNLQKQRKETRHVRSKNERREWFRRNRLLLLVLSMVVVLITAYIVNQAWQKKRFRDQIEQRFVAGMNEWQSRRREALRHIESPQKSEVYKFDNEHKVSVLYDGGDKIELRYSFLGTQNIDNEDLYIASMIAVARFVPDNINYFLLADSIDYVFVAYARDPKTRRFEQVSYEHVSKAVRDCLGALPEKSAKHISGIMTSIGLKADFSKTNEFGY